MRLSLGKHSTLPPGKRRGYTGDSLGGSQPLLPSSSVVLDVSQRIPGPGQEHGAWLVLPPSSALQLLQAESKGRGNNRHRLH